MEPEGSRLVVVPLQDAQRALAEIMQGALRVVVHTYCVIGSTMMLVMSMVIRVNCPVRLLIAARVQCIAYRAIAHKTS